MSVTSIERLEIGPSVISCLGVRVTPPVVIKDVSMRDARERITSIAGEVTAVPGTSYCRLNAVGTRLIVFLFSSYQEVVGIEEIDGLAIV